MTGGANSVYFVGEIGVLTLAITIIAAVFILIRDRKVFGSNAAV
jgi:hypothetical protein